MAFRDYTDQVLLEGDNVHHYEANEAVSQGQLVKYDTNNTGRTVEPSDTDGEDKLAGFALYDASSGEQVAVAQAGCIVRATSGTGTIASGDWIASHGGTGNEGEVAAATETSGGSTTTLGDYCIGQAVEDDAGSANDVIVRVDNVGLV